MKNLINEQICIWLVKYSQQTSNKSIQKTSQELLNQIPSTLTLTELIDLFKSYTSKENHSRSIYFQSALLDWQKRLEQRLKDQELAKARIQQIMAHPKIAPLITMLHELLNEPLIILHVQASQLLKLINNEHFDQLITFISQQKIKPAPASPASLVVKNRNLGERLLEALAGKKEENNPLWSDAYSLIEAVLVFYIEDMHLVEIALSQEKLPPPEERLAPKETCVIL